MNVSAKLSPSITNLIRMDHTKVLAVFHKYEAHTVPQKKRAIVNTICLAVEIHARLEEEIFYPAIEAVDASLVEKSVPEHEQIHRLIAILRSMEPVDESYDDVFMDLMRTIIHHVADEETVLLQKAERLLKDQLSALGAQMTTRRMKLMAPHIGELARNTTIAMPAATLLGGAAALLAGSYLLRHRNSRWLERLGRIRTAR
jgi:hemerythrin superfamily protein